LTNVDITKNNDEDDHMGDINEH